jgi:hypothetical protein
MPLSIINGIINEGQPSTNTRTIHNSTTAEKMQHPHDGQLSVRTDTYTHTYKQAIVPETEESMPIKSWSSISLFVQWQALCTTHRLACNIMQPGLLAPADMSEE